MPFVPFKNVRVGFAERTVYRPGMEMPRLGEYVVRDYEFARVTRVTVTQAEGDGRPEELEAERGDYIHSAEYEYLPSCSCGFVPTAKDCERHTILTYPELEAARRLYESPIEVGHEGIGGFAAGQAEEVILALRIAGFPVDPDQRLPR